MSSAKLKVFISYSRSDMIFADEIVAGLDFHGGFKTTYDRDSIIEGEDWKQRLGALIADADTVVFILSPHSAKSKVCLWEVSEAQRLSKRILPALWQSLGEVAAPAPLAALNYVRFDGDQSFMNGLERLVKALKMDLEWLRQHTRLQTLAIEWDAASRVDNRLLLGSAIAESRSWLNEKPKDAPAPTELHHAFIHASEAAEVARQSIERERAERLQKAVMRTRIALVGAVVLAVLAAAAGTWATKERAVAQHQAGELLKANAISAQHLDALQDAAIDLIILQSTVRSVLTGMDFGNSRSVSKLDSLVYQKVIKATKNQIVLECKKAKRLQELVKRQDIIGLMLSELAVANREKVHARILKQWKQEAQRLSTNNNCQQGPDQPNTQ